MAEPIFDHEQLDVYRLSIEYFAFSYKIAKSLGGTSRQARDQWLRAAIDDDSSQIGNSNLKRIVSMLTRLIQRTTGVSEDQIEYEYEYRPDSSGLSTSTIPVRNPDEPSDATERKWRSDFS
jgi:hypothetical protein